MMVLEKKTCLVTLLFCMAVYTLAGTYTVRTVTFVNTSSNVNASKLLEATLARLVKHQEQMDCV